MRNLLAVFVAASLIAAAQTQPRTVPTPRNDYLTFIHPDAEAVIGFDFKPVTVLIDAMMNQMLAAPGVKVTKSPTKGMDALKELDRVWVSVRGGAGSQDVLALMTGRFERGGMASEVAKTPGMTRVFLGGPNVMLVGPDAAVKTALLRMNDAKGGQLPWMVEQARDLSEDHDFWFAVEPKANLQQIANQLNGIREFSMGMKLHDQTRLDGELIVNSDARMDQLMAEIDKAKAKMMRENPKARAMLNGMTVEREGTILRFSAEGGKLNPHQFAAELGKQMKTLMSGLTGGAVSQSKPIEPPKALIAEEKLQTVKKGMTREEVVSLIGKPQMVSSVSGLEVPRETWVYQTTSGRKVTIRLDDGIVTAGSHL